MMFYKVTPSLYSAWLFFAKPQFDRTTEDELIARDEFIRVLRKERGEETDAMRRGVLFENMIMRACTGARLELPDELGKDGKPLFKDTEHDIECVRHIGEIVKDGIFQEKDGRELPSGNYIYGVADCILLNRIIDFKYTDNYEMGKYQKSIQHWAYLYIWQMKDFDYLVGDGSAIPFVEPYVWSDNSLAILESKIGEMIHWINLDSEMREIFVEFWNYDNKKEEK